MTDQDATSTRHYPCTNCGARVEFAPGTTVLRCPYCGHEQAVAADDRTIEEQSYDAWAALAHKPVAQLGAYVYSCTGCGAKTETDDLSDRCPFCAAPIVVDPAAMELIAPEAVVPFKIPTTDARSAFRRWVTSRWFAPSALKKVAATEKMDGTYLPHWTFDAQTDTDYTGQRGEHYWETETYTETVDGQPQTRTREVMKTRWYPAWGHVSHAFDDVLVPGTTKVPHKRLDKLGPWQLQEAVPFQTDYLSGYRTLRYDVEPDTGLTDAKQQMQVAIEHDCRDDIGGDEQRVNSMDTSYADLMFKLMLLPVWIAAYIYAGRTWQVMVNANTGEVIGDRPYSKVKIAAAVLLVVVVAAIAILVYRLRR